MPRRLLTAIAVLAAGLLGACAHSARPATPAVADGATFDLVVASTTDQHGRLRGWDYFADAPDTLRGLSRAATIVDSLRAAAPGRVVLIDAGDLLQGNPLTYVAARGVEAGAPRAAPGDTMHPVIAAMNAMAYDAAAIGNHEFNYGLDVLSRAIAQARFPLMAANAYKPDGSHAYPQWRMIDRGGVRVAIVGATTPGAMVWDRDNLRGRLVVRDILPSVRAAVDAARRAGADVVIVSVHSGLHEPSSYDTVTTGVPSENVAARIAREVPGIDMVLFGHSHNQLPDTIINGALLTQPKNWATSVGVTHIGLERRAGRWHVSSKKGTLVRTAGHRESAAVLAATEGAHRRTVAYATTPIGSTTTVWSADSARVADTPLIDFILEVERKAAGSDLASTAAFSLDATIDSGPITVAEIARLYPYENTLRAVRITGRQLRDYLEFSARYYRSLDQVHAGQSIVDPAVPGFNFDIVQGVEYTIDLRQPIGRRITTLEFKGRPVTNGDSFTMALNNYRQTGGGGYAMLAGAPVVFDQQQEIRQLLIEEVRRRGVLRPDDFFKRNWSLEPPEAVAQAFAAMQRMPGEGGHATSTSPRPASTSDAAATRPTSARRTVPFPRGTPFLRLIGTNDFHGALATRADSAGRLSGGAAPLASAIRGAVSECQPDCQSLLVDAGDQFQGTLASNIAYGLPVVDLYNALGLAASAVGNHEFDWGQDTLRARIRGAKYAVLGANVRNTDGTKVSWLRDDTIVVRGGKRIGITGLAMPSTPASSKPKNVKGLRFLDPAPVIDTEAKKLRARGADVVIVLIHTGAYCSRDGRTDCKGEIVDVANRLTEKVDAIVSGHTHSLVNTRVNGIPIVQARSSARAVAIVDIPLVAGLESRSDVRDVRADSFSPQPDIDAIANRAWALASGRATRRVAELPVTLARTGDQYPLGNLVTDAQRWAGRADVSVMNNSGIRAGINAGMVTYGALYDVSPFANLLVKMTVRGSDLMTYLESLVKRDRVTTHVSGVTIEFDTARAPGSRITRATLADGRPIDPAKLYTIVMNDFMGDGGDGLQLRKTSASSETLNVEDLDALVGYLQQLPQPIRVPGEIRMKHVGR